MNRSKIIVIFLHWETFKLAEYFLPSTGFDVITHFITYLTPTYTKYAVSVVALTTLQQVVNDE